VIKSGRIRWAGHVALMGKRRVVYWGLVGSPEEKSHLEKLGVEGSIILKWVFKSDW
jgi:hypothetical protein